MMEFWTLYISGFWVWLGMTIGLYLGMVSILGLGLGVGRLFKSQSKESSDV